MTGTDTLRTRHLGEIEWSPGSEISLPFGLPGFEAERRMLPVEIPAQRPLVFLQSLDNPEVCFVALPVRTIDPSFSLALSEDDHAALRFDTPAPQIGQDVLCLALLIPDEGTVRANLTSPVVINLHNSRCMQAFACGPGAGSYRLSSAGQWERTCS